MLSIFSIKSFYAQKYDFSAFVHGGSNNGVVGKIDDEFSVTPSGQVSYEIPITLMGETGGVAPKLSVSYSSSSAIGLLGFGFDLTGLSMIQRVPANRFNDGFSGSVDVTTARFALDGSRLIRVKRESGKYLYATEQDNFARITAYGDKVNPDSFVVNTKAGLTYLYESSSSLLGSTSPSLYWMVTKVSDTNGNYFDVAYGGNKSDNEIYPERISYTSNDLKGHGPWYALIFEYKSASVPINYVLAPRKYIAGMPVRKNHILKSISLYSGSVKLKEYGFSYQYKAGNAFLDKISLKSSDGKSWESLNPTKIDWSFLNDLKFTEEKDYMRLPVKDNKLFVLDFNNDGLSDCLSVPAKSDTCKWDLFVSTGGDKTNFIVTNYGVFTDKDNNAIKGKVEDVVTGDFNNDGHVDCVVMFHIDNSYKTYLYLNTLTPNTTNKQWYRTFQMEKELYYGSEKGEMSVVEINDDGIPDLLIRFNETHCSLKKFISRTNDGYVTPLKYYETQSFGRNLELVKIIDFDGDGLNDILDLRDDGYRVYSLYEHSSFYDKVASGDYPRKGDYVYCGDLNGDGKTDLLCASDSKKCTPYFSTGKEFVKLLPGSNPLASSNGDINLFPASETEMFLVDLNGDGLDDVVGIDRRLNNGKGIGYPQIYINNGDCLFEKVEDTRRQRSLLPLEICSYYVGDFNGDGKQDFFCTGNPDNTNYSKMMHADLYWMSVTPNNLVSRITDGMGNSTEIEYKYMSDKDVYTRDDVQYENVKSISGSWPLVYQVKTPNGDFGVDTVRYSYHNALMHTGGRGILGFESMTTLDLTTNTKTIQTNVVYSSHYILVPSSSETYINDRLVAESSTCYDLFVNSKNKYVYSYLPTEKSEREYEYNSGEPIKDVLTFMQYDEYGNATEIETDDMVSTTITSNEYVNDTVRWFLGRLTNTKVEKYSSGKKEVRKSAFEYDDVTGLLRAEIIEPDNKALGYRKTYERDVYGNITKSTITPFDTKYSPRVTESEYEKYGRFLVKEKNALGFVQSYDLDEYRGLVLKSTDANGLVTENTYDAFGNVVKVQTPLSTTYTTAGWVKELYSGAIGIHAKSDLQFIAPYTAKYFVFTETPGHSSSVEFFDCLGRSIQTVTVKDYYDENGAGDARKKIETGRDYNRKGQVVYEYGPCFDIAKNVPVTYYFYDECGRVIKKIGVDNDTTTFEYDGLITTVTDAKGHTSKKEVDMQGRMVRSTDALGGEVLYYYDASGRNVKIVGPKKEITMGYDIMGNRISMHDPDVSDGTIFTSYNAFGEIVKTEDSHGVTTFEYDNGGRLIKETRPDMTVTKSYDKQLKGFLDYVKNDKVQVSYFYDEYGRTIRETQKDDNTQRTDEVSYEYDGYSRLEYTNYPSGLRVRNHYSRTGELLSVEDANDKNKCYWQLGYNRNQTFNAINARGQILCEKYGNGIITNVEYYNSTGRIKNIHAMQSNGDLLRWTYLYDKNGCLKERTDDKRDLTESFDYDALDRLICANKNGKAYQTMRYDAAGNIIYKSDVGEYVYEENSNRLREVISTSYKPMEWDEIQYTSFNKIRSVVAGKNRMNINYGPSKNRTSMVIDENGQKTTYGYFGSLFEYVQKNGENTYKNYIFAAGKCVAIVENVVTSKTSKTRTLYVHHDYLGSILAYSDEKQDLVSELSYDAWGRRRNPDNWEYYDKIADADALQNRGFGGHEHLDLFEMINMNGRMYDPVLGRFLSPDPLIQAPDFTQSLNRYSYCLNNPLALIDPSGYSWFSKNWKSLVAACVGIAVSALTAGSASGLGIAIIAGAAGGAASAFTGALLNGANIGEILKSTIGGGFMGALSGGLNYFAGGGDFLMRIVKHSCFDAAMEGIQGGNMLHGFISGAINGASDTFIGGMDMTKGLRIACNAIIGGTVSEIGGGKFANGAITSAFSMMFNGLMHPEGNKRAARLEYEEIGGGYYSNGVLVGEKPLKSVYPEFDLLLGGSLTKGLGRALKSVNGSIKGFANWVKSKTQGSFFKGTKLSNAAKEKALRGNYHGFPDSVEAFEKYGVRYKAMGKDGNMYEHLDIKGSYHGNDGTFQFIKDGDNIITHRFFKKQ